MGSSNQKVGTVHYEDLGWMSCNDAEVGPGLDEEVCVLIWVNITRCERCYLIIWLYITCIGTQ